MKKHWSLWPVPLQLIPELAAMPPAEQRAAFKAAHRLWRWRIFRHWQTWLGFLAGGMCAGCAVFLGQAFFGFGHPLVVLFGFLGGGFCGWVGSQILAIQALPYIREYLEGTRERVAQTERGVPE